MPSWSESDLEWSRLYSQWWAPVIGPTGLRLFEVGDESLDGRIPERIVDVGTGTGTLAFEALRRWPEALVTGVDVDGAMLSVAKERSIRSLDAEQRARLELVVGEAARLPLPDASVDAAVSAFVYQIVPDRLAALREAWRILKPEGVLAFVTWDATEPEFAPRTVFYDAIEEMGLQLPEEEEAPRAGGIRSPGAARAQLRRAGFRRIRAWRQPLGYQFDPDFYLEEKVRLGEGKLFESLDPETRDRLIALIRERFASLSPEEFVFPDPVVFAAGVRPA